MAHQGDHGLTEKNVSANFPNVWSNDRELDSNVRLILASFSFWQISGFT
jgi:hypothetical protein